MWRLSAHLLFLWHKASLVAASTCVRVRSCVRCRRRGSQNGWAERQGTLLSFFSFPSATLNIIYILHWVIRPWLSHVFIRFIFRESCPFSRRGSESPAPGREVGVDRRMGEWRGSSKRVLAWIAKSVIHALTHFIHIVGGSSSKLTSTR